MTPTYYLYNGQLFEIDRMPPDGIDYFGFVGEKEVFDTEAYDSDLAAFHAYLSTLQPIPHTFSGESRVIQEDQIEWVYEAKITFIESTWIETSEEKYNGLPDDQRRRVATPITEAKPQTECASVNQGMECMCANEGYDMTQCPHYKPLTAQPDQEAAEKWISDHGVKFMAIEQQRNAFLAGCKHVRAQQGEIAKQLQEIRAAFQWTFDNMNTPHTSDHFNVPANGIEQIDQLLTLFTSQTKQP